MLTNEHDLRELVEDRNRELRRDAAMYRLAQSIPHAAVSGPSLLDRIRPLLARLHVARPVPGQAKASA